MERRLRLAATVTVGALALAGCSSMVASQSASPPNQPEASVPAAHIPTTGVLVATNPAEKNLHLAWTADAWQVASVAGQSSARVIVDRFGAGPGSSDVMFNAPLASTTGLNSLIIHAQVKDAEEKMVAAFGREQAVATPGSVDLISGIRAMEDHLRELHAVNPDLIIFGDAVQTAGSVNLADPVQLADPAAALEKLKAQGLLQPSACHGWSVYMVDPSPAGFSALQDEQLREFWREFFAACGGHLVLWDRILIFPASGQVPAESGAVGGHREITVPLPASLLFAPNRATLLPSADRPLGELCRDLTSTYPTATAEIDGYTAAAGGGNGVALSQARAQSVASYLEACRVAASRLSTHGYGDYRQIPGGLAINRRVVVTLQIPESVAADTR